MASKQKLGTIEEIEDLRTVWPNEAADFTPWVASDEGSALLGDAIGMDLTIDDTEHVVGSFSADVTATEDVTGRRVVIENQLEETNHDHLGKIITYAAGVDASYVVWVVRRARDEHRAAIEWLNSHTDDSVGFFLCEVHLYRIGDSAPAPMYSIIEAPNDWMRQQRRIADGSVSDAEQRALEYWTAFNDHAWGSPKFAKVFHMRKPLAKRWYDLSIGTSEPHITLRRQQMHGSVSAELYIGDSKVLFDSTLAHKEEVEAEIGERLDWKRLDNRKASRIVAEREFAIDDQDKWPSEFDWLMDMALRMKEAFSKYL